jgi:hypothetical protein
VKIYWPLKKYLNWRKSDMEEPLYPSNPEPMSQLAKKYLLQVEGHASNHMSYPLQLAAWGVENLQLEGRYAEYLKEWVYQALGWKDDSVRNLLFHTEDGDERVWKLSQHKTPESLALGILGQMQDRITLAKNMPYTPSFGEAEAMDPKPDKRALATSVWGGFKEWLANLPPLSPLSLAVILAVIIYCFCTRYQMVGGGGRGVGYMYNRITGACWFLAGKNYFRIEPGYKKISTASEGFKVPTSGPPRVLPAPKE